MGMRTLNSPCNASAQVQRYLGTAYDTVKSVSDNMDKVDLVAEMLEKYGVLLCFNSAADLATVDPTLATFARVYDTTDPLNLYYKDYVYQTDNTDGLPAKNGIGSWVEMDSINSVFGSMAWVYNGGAAVGGETMLTLDIETLSITDLYVNGSYQTYGLNFSFNAATQEITLSQELKEGDMVVAKLSGVPALAPSSSVDNFHFLNFVYNDGRARGGETVIDTGIPFMNITSVFKNGARLLYGEGKQFTYSAETHTITFATALAEGDVIQATLGGNIDNLSEATGAMASKTVQYYQLAKNLIDNFGLAVSDAQGYANDSQNSADASAASAQAASGSAANAKQSETNAAASETAAKTSETNAASSASAAALSATQAASSQTAAATSAAAAATSATNSANSASAASTSASNAKTSETNAGTKATAAATSATAAASSATAASNSASTASTQATNAAASATTATNQATAAASSAGIASQQATNAATSATAAAASQTAAATSATNAATSETNAKTSETNAAASATAAATSATNAANSAASYSNLQSADDGKGDALLAVKAPYTGSVAITQHTKNLQSVYAPEMGLLPGNNVQTVFNAAVLAAANAGKELVVPAGTYTISGAIQLPSNTRLRLEPGCIIQRDTAGTTFRVMFQNASDGTVGGYAAQTNILVYGGGTIDGNSAMSTIGCSGMAFSHVTNVLITDLDIINMGTTGHAIEFNAAKNAFAVNVRANGAGTPSVVTNEAFQIDAAVSNVYFPWFGPYDNTACDHVGFINCSVNNYGVGIGSNSDGSINHKNIILRDNRLTCNIAGINMTGWDNVNVENNEITWGALSGTVMIAGIQATYNTSSGSTLGSTNLNIKNNYIHDIVPADLTIDPTTNWYGVKLVGSSSNITRVRDLILHHNHIENTGNSAVNGQYLTNVLLDGNRLGTPKCTGATGLESQSILDSNRVQTVACRMEGDVTVGKGTLTTQTHIFKDNWVGGTLAVGTTLFTKGQVSGNHAVTAVPAAITETARIVGNNTVG